MPNVPRKMPNFATLIGRPALQAVLNRFDTWEKL